MQKFWRIFRPSGLDKEQMEQTQQIISRSRELLSKLVPDSFFGRKTQEPFPHEDDE